MKKTVKCFLIFMLGFGFSGCDDFLNLVPESNYSAAGFYRTQQDFETAIAAVYASQQDLFTDGWYGWIRVLNGRGDETRANMGYVESISNFTDGDQVPGLTALWRRFWVMISRSNMILDKIDDATFTDASMKDYIKGEAYIMRGYAYWNLSWAFGGMPLITKALSVEETMTTPRSTQAETYALAEEDLKNAYNLLPEAWSGASLGRATKYAAAGILARMLLFQNRFGDAKTYLGAIVNSGKYTMAEDYVDCFTDAGDNGPERVWDIQFMGGQLGEGMFIAEFPEGVQTDEYPAFGSSSATPVADSFVEKYESGDTRKEVSVVNNMIISGMVDPAWRVVKYMHYVDYAPKTNSDWANNIPILRYTDVLMMYAEVLNEESYSGEGEAMDILNNVRKRAGLEPYTSADLPDKTSFRNAIIKERAVEFAFEGLRWYDLLRWGIAKEVMNEFFKSPKEGNGTYFMEDFRAIFAIPSDELLRYNNTAIMWQNPGY
jgi:hypothetical protein